MIPVSSRAFGWGGSHGKPNFVQQSRAVGFPPDARVQLRSSQVRWFPTYTWALALIPKPELPPHSREGALLWPPCWVFWGSTGTEGRLRKTEDPPGLWNFLRTHQLLHGDGARRGSGGHGPHQMQGFWEEGLETIRAPWKVLNNTSLKPKINSVSSSGPPGGCPGRPVQLCWNRNPGQSARFRPRKWQPGNPLAPTGQARLGEAAQHLWQGHRLPYRTL